MEADVPSGVLRQGTCGFTAPRGAWDPPPAQRRTTLDKLSYYSRRLPCVEIDGSTYKCPTAEQTQAWVSATPPGFAFCVKAFGPLCTRRAEIDKLPRSVRPLLGSERAVQSFTGEGVGSAVVDAVWARFNAALEPLIRADKVSWVRGALVAQLLRCGPSSAMDARVQLSAVLFQFPLGFAPSEESAAYLVEVRRRLHPRASAAFEFRDHRWFLGARDEPRVDAASVRAAFLASDFIPGAGGGTPAHAGPYGHERRMGIYPAAAATFADSDRESSSVRESREEQDAGDDGEPASASASGGRGRVGSGGSGTSGREPTTAAVVELELLAADSSAAAAALGPVEGGVIATSGAPHEAAEASTGLPEEGSQMCETLDLLRALDAALVASDDLLDEMYGRSALSRRTLPIHLHVTSTSLAYIRVHRREGTDRLLTKDEQARWAARLRKFVTESLIPPFSCVPVFMFWGTDHEEQPFRNADALRALVPTLVVDWSAHVRAVSATDRSSLRSYFSASASSASAASAGATALADRVRDDDDDDGDGDDERDDTHGAEGGPRPPGKAKSRKRSLEERGSSSEDVSVVLVEERGQSEATPAAAAVAAATAAAAATTASIAATTAASATPSASAAAAARGGGPAAKSKPASASSSSPAKQARLNAYFAPRKES